MKLEENITDGASVRMLTLTRAHLPQSTELQMDTCKNIRTEYNLKAFLNI